MDIEKLIRRLRNDADAYRNGETLGRAFADQEDVLDNAATALSTLKAENEKLRNEVERQRRSADDRKHLYENAERAYMKVVAELEQVKRLYESEKEDFLDYACSGIPNFAPYCFNRHPDCVDERGWCKSAECHGFSRNRGQKED